MSQFKKRTLKKIELKSLQEMEKKFLDKKNCLFRLYNIS